MCRRSRLLCGAIYGEEEKKVVFFVTAVPTRMLFLQRYPLLNRKKNFSQTEAASLPDKIAALLKKLIVVRSIESGRLDQVDSAINQVLQMRECFNVLKSDSLFYSVKAGANSSGADVSTGMGMRIAARIAITSISASTFENNSRRK